MGKFKDRVGHTRWQEARNDIRNWIADNPRALPILNGVIKVAVPRVASVMEAIEEVKESKVSAVDKKAIEARLLQLSEDLDGDGIPDALQDPQTDFPGKKYITPVLLLVIMFNYFHLQLCTMYNWAPVEPSQMELAAEMMWTSVGLWQGGRILNNFVLNKKK
jgi:hypothetical protein